MKIIVSGSAGFLGSNLVKRLIRDVYEVVEWDIMEGNDVCNPNLTADGLDAIFHLACPVDPEHYQDVALPTILASSQGTYNMLELAKKNNAKFLYVSSSEVYGDSTSLPYKEDDPGVVATWGDRAYYGESKRFGEMMTIVYHQYYGLDTRIVRPFNIYGPGMRHDDSRVIPSFMRNKKEGKSLIVNDLGQSTRTFCYVDDFIEVLMRAMFYPNTNGQVFNLGSEESITMLQLASMISSNIKIAEDTRSGEQKHRKPDINKAKTILDWQPKISLKEGLEEMWKNFQ